MDKKIEVKDKLFFNVEDINHNSWLINKKHIVSAVMPLKQGAATRIVLTTGAIIDTYLNLGTLIGITNEVEHKPDPEAKP